MRTAPAFWWRPVGPAALLLAPAGFVVGALAARRLARPPRFRAPVPVLCVGNFVAGGAGKTPAALACAARVRALGAQPVMLTRGYGGRLEGPVVVAPGHTAADVGDEALLLARAAPTVVSRDRAEGAKAALAAGADIIIMDDGFQNPGLAKTATVMVVDGGVGTGNGLCLPAGPLRAPLGRQMARTRLVMIVGGPAQDGREPSAAVVASARSAGVPVMAARLVPEAPERFRGRRVLGYAGIGRPEKFFATLRETGADVAETHAFPDHHPFSEVEAAALLARAEALGATLVTTAKDHARLPATGIFARLAAASDVLAVVLEPAGEADELGALIAGLLEAPR